MRGVALRFISCISACPCLRPALENAVDGLDIFRCGWHLGNVVGVLCGCVQGSLPKRNALPATPGVANAWTLKSTPAMKRLRERCVAEKVFVRCLAPCCRRRLSAQRPKDTWRGFVVLPIPYRSSRSGASSPSSSGRTEFPWLVWLMLILFRPMHSDSMKPTLSKSTNLLGCCPNCCEALKSVGTFIVLKKPTAVNLPCRDSKECSQLSCITNIYRVYSGSLRSPFVLSLLAVIYKRTAQTVATPALWNLEDCWSWW